MQSCWGVRDFAVGRPARRVGEDEQISRFSKGRDDGQTPGEAPKSKLEPRALL